MTKDDPKTEDAKILWSFHIWVTEVKGSIWV